MILIFFFATGLSFFLHEPFDAFIILLIIFARGLLGFWQERSAPMRFGWASMWVSARLDSLAVSPQQPGILSETELKEIL